MVCASPPFRPRIATHHFCIRAQLTSERDHLPVMLLSRHCSRPQMRQTHVFVAFSTAHWDTLRPARNAWKGSKPWIGWTRARYVTERRGTWEIPDIPVISEFFEEFPYFPSLWIQLWNVYGAERLVIREIAVIHVLHRPRLLSGLFIFLALGSTFFITMSRNLPPYPSIVTRFSEIHLL